MEVIIVSNRLLMDDQCNDFEQMDVNSILLIDDE